MISVIICTRNRSEYLPECIESLLNQETEQEFELLVVDNDSLDDTENVICKYGQISAQIYYYKEKKIGLSYARNTGYKKASYDWVAYVDDDAKAHPDFVEVACDTILHQKFDCFGGIYNAWFKYEFPQWLPEGFGSNRARMPNIIITLKDESFSGGVAVYKKELLERIGGFPTDMGMKGESIGYGEENYVQMKARELGYKVGFNPNLQIDHVVRKEKLQKSWHYQDAYQKGISKARLQQDNKIDRNILKYGILEMFKYPIRFILNRSTFMGNRNMMYYFGYFSHLRKRR